jgi:RHS repeat-associated protein
MNADFAYAGYYYHQPSGLYLTLYRAYDSDLGRWLSRDPVEEKGGFNLYVYVVNNPIVLIDPDGLKPLTADDCNTFRRDMLVQVAKESAEQSKIHWYKEGSSVIAGGAVGALFPPAGVVVWGVGTGDAIYDVGDDMSQKTELIKNVTRLYNLCMEQVASSTGHTDQ